MIFTAFLQKENVYCKSKHVPDLHQAKSLGWRSYRAEAHQATDIRSTSAGSFVQSEGPNLGRTQRRELGEATFQHISARKKHNTIYVTGFQQCLTQGVWKNQIWHEYGLEECRDPSLQAYELQISDCGVNSVMVRSAEQRASGLRTGVLKGSAIASRFSSTHVEEDVA